MKARGKGRKRNTFIVLKENREKFYFDAFVSFCCFVGEENEERREEEKKRSARMKHSRFLKMNSSLIKHCKCLINRKRSKKKINKAYFSLWISIKKKISSSIVSNKPRSTKTFLWQFYQIIN